MAIYVRNGQGALEPYKVVGLKGDKGDKGEKGDKGVFIGEVSTAPATADVIFDNSDIDVITEGIAPNIQIGEVTTVESGEKAEVIRKGTNKNPIFDFKIPRGESGTAEENILGERLMAHYVHNSNKEIHFSSFDFETGIGTTTEPHGIETPVGAFIVPNDWTLKNPTNNVICVPFEWTQNITWLVKVDENTLKVTKQDKTSIITINFSEPANSTIDITKFHFEIPKLWSITNFDIDSKHIYMLSYGYSKSVYRYKAIQTIDNDGVLRNQQYISNLSPMTLNNAVNCILGYQKWDLDFRFDFNIRKLNNWYYSRRKGYSHLVWDSREENVFSIAPTEGNGVKRIELVSTLRSDDYAYMSNGTNVFIYDLGGN